MLPLEAFHANADGRGPICQVEEVEGAICSDVNDVPAEIFRWIGSWRRETHTSIRMCFHCYSLLFVEVVQRGISASGPSSAACGA
jgi:hypothetical protein